eukprot:TRINITY_DN3052_c2_g1_i1.p1 TRINITY_DN3052_c2_g1~~TRINITY_DN3052_c2_g1_i1.p1  ORF type:complete len:186 (+),score=50.69 TRINITY_DN3052_c2_g1_i1:80-559(+)
MSTRDHAQEELLKIERERLLDELKGLEKKVKKKKKEKKRKRRRSDSIEIDQKRTRHDSDSDISCGGEEAFSWMGLGDAPGAKKVKRHFSKTILIGGLAPGTGTGDIRQVFSAPGPIADIRLFETCALLTYNFLPSVGVAIKTLQNKRVAGQAVTVSVAE